ncbi:DUF2635 domain-containing protein [Xenorhabdus nematophila]|nr:DUF2635 domain-containing protein [Xenorhabdus nematophila]CEK24256.1 Mu-like prophage FluMu protein gp38 [Xenorhabdus nematophila AN6/1]
MTELHLKPVNGLIVRDPDTYQPLPDDGEAKPCTAYWLRRLKDGDVKEIVPLKLKKGAQ